MAFSGREGSSGAATQEHHNSEIQVLQVKHTWAMLTFVFFSQEKHFFFFWPFFFQNSSTTCPEGLRTEKQSREHKPKLMERTTQRPWYLSRRGQILVATWFRSPRTDETTIGTAQNRLWSALYQILEGEPKISNLPFTVGPFFPERGKEANALTELSSWYYLIKKKAAFPFLVLDGSPKCPVHSLHLFHGIFTHWTFHFWGNDAFKGEFCSKTSPPWSWVGLNNP